MPDIGLTIYIIFFGLFIISSACLIGRFLEAKDWNHGRCKECNDSWDRFDTDSQGGRGYKCGCGNMIWISYKVDRKRRY